MLAFIFWVKLLSFSFQLLVFSSEYTGFFKCGHFIDFDAGAGYFIRDHAKYYPGERKAGIIFACGLCTGLIAHTAAVSLGLSLILYNSPVAFSVLKYMGAAYLIYLGVKSYIHRKENSLALPTAAGVEYKLYRKGILMNILNPKVLLFFIAFFPQFVSPATENPAGELLVLGLLFMAQAIVIFSLIALLADRLSRRLMQNARFSLIMHIIESLVYLPSESV